MKQNIETVETLAKAYESVPHQSSPEPKTFRCADCQKDIPLPPPGHTGAAGYAITRDGKHICYECSAHRYKMQMIQTGKVVLYLAPRSSSCDRWEVLDWAGKLRFPVLLMKKSGTRSDVWFTGPDGENWHGINIGDSQICRCRRNKS